MLLYKRIKQFYKHFNVEDTLDFDSSGMYDHDALMVIYNDIKDVMRKRITLNEYKRLAELCEQLSNYIDELDIQQYKSRIMGNACVSILGAVCTGLYIAVILSGYGLLSLGIIPSILLTVCPLVGIYNDIEKFGGNDYDYCE